MKSVQQINEAIENGIEIQLLFEGEYRTVLQVSSGRCVTYLLDRSRNGSFHREVQVGALTWQMVVTQVEKGQ